MSQANTRIVPRFVFCKFACFVIQTSLKASLHGVGDPGLVGKVSCFHALADTKQKKPTPLDRGPPPPCKQGLRLTTSFKG